MSEFVYVVRCGKYIKIGRTSNPLQRIQRLRTDDTTRPVDFDRHQPLEIMHLQRGGAALEATALDSVADYRHTGEWFRAEPELVAWAEQLDGSEFPTLIRPEGALYNPDELTHEDYLAAEAIGRVFASAGIT